MVIHNKKIITQKYIPFLFLFVIFISLDLKDSFSYVVFELIILFVYLLFSFIFFMKNYLNYI